MVAKFGPTRTSFGKMRPFLANKHGRENHFWQPNVVGGTIFGNQNWCGGPLLGRTNFHVTDLATECVTTSKLLKFKVYEESASLVPIFSIMVLD